MQIKKVKVTPKKAEQWLEKNFRRNRKLRPAHVGKLASDMLADKWHDTGDPIKFNMMDQLIDGQHRLSAVVMSGKTVTFTVATDVSNDAINVIDTGASRSAGDVLAIAGNSTYPKHLPTLIRRIHAWKKKTGDKNLRLRRGSLSSQAILEYAMKHPGLDEHIKFSFEAYAKSVNPYTLKQGEWAFLHWLFSQKDRNAAGEFLLALAQLNCDMDSPIRTYFQRLTGGAIQLPFKLKINFAIRTWNDWRNGKKNVKLKVRQADEEPVPELV